MTSSTRRESPMHAEISHMRPRLQLVHEMEAAAQFGEAARERKLVEKLALCDVSAFPRLAVKGPGAQAWLEANGVKIPQGIYDHLDLEKEGLIVRLGTTEFFIEDGAESHWVDQLSNRPAATDQSCYLFSRQDAGMVLAGAEAFEVLAQTCGYNFKEPDRDFIASRVAGVSCLIMRQDRHGVPAFRIWCDGSYGAYLWEELLTIIRELGGDCVGMSCLFPVP